jgi:acyl-CoA synthetase (AMP-forming)/AMP-acid ligase II
VKRFGVDREWSPEQMIIADSIKNMARKAPSAAAIGVRGGRFLNYGEVDERTDRLANALLGSGLRSGDVVGAWMEDGHEYLELYLAVAKAGLVIAPVNARFKSEEASYVFERANISALFFTDSLAPMVEEAAEESRPRLVVSPGSDLVRGAVGYEDLLSRAAARFTAPYPAAGSPYILAFTSGTTGYPKAAVLTHASVVNVCRSQVAALRLPLYGVRAHTNSMSFTASVPAHLMSTIYTGGASYLMGTGWHIDELVDAVARYGVTHTTIPSPFVGEFAEHVAQAPERLGSLQSILHAGSKVDVGYLEQLRSAVGYRFIEGWGMTENSGGVICVTSVKDADGTSPLGNEVLETVGRPVPEAEVMVIDENGEPLPCDGQSVGELVVRTPCLVDGYWQDEDATKTAFRDGWYHTGDLGSIDAFGYVRIADRRADLIVSGGMNVYPAEVERVLKRHESVLDCAVVGAPHPRWGQTVVAVIVARPGTQLDEEGAIQFCRERLAGYKKPTAVVFVDRLPRNASDKVLRRDLRQMVASVLESRTRA